MVTNKETTQNLIASVLSFVLPMSNVKDTSRVRGPKEGKVKYPGGTRAAQLEKELQRLRDEFGQELVQITAAANAPGAPTSGQDGLNQPLQTSADDPYPVKLYEPDPYDTMVQMKTKLLGGQPGVATPFGQAMLTTDDLRWMRDKQAQATAAEFKQFVGGQLFNVNDPRQRDELNKVYPELLQEQEKIISDRADFIKRLALMRLHGGPQDKDDVRLLFALNSGAVRLPQGDLWRPSSWENVSADLSEAANAVQRGFFSPQRYYARNSSNMGKMPFDALTSVMNTAGTPPGGSAQAQAPSPYPVMSLIQ